MSANINSRTLGRWQALKKSLISTKSLLWLLITVGAGLLQVWLLLIVMLLSLLYPSERARLGIDAWGIAQVLGNSVLIFFATSLLGQTLYTMTEIKDTRRYHRYFAVVFMVFFSIVAFILYFLNMLLGEPEMQLKYVFDIAFALLALAYAAHVQFRSRRRLAPGVVQGR